MKTRLALLCAGLALPLLAPGANAQSHTLYFNSFETRTLGPEWSSGTRLDWA